MVDFTSERRAFRRTVRDLGEAEIAPRVDESEAAGGFGAHELFGVLGDVGLLGFEYDSRYGGRDMASTSIGGGTDEMRLHILTENDRVHS